MDGYPSRGIRTKEYLYIRNLFPDRWPAGVPEGSTHPFGSYADCDAGPTRQFILDNADDPSFTQFLEWNFEKRPAEELYDISNDPYQLNNLVEDPNYEDVKKELERMLVEYLENTGDPRFTDEEAMFDSYPYRSRYALNK